jgi:N-acetylmuramoyl-L-alanine amidase
MKVPRVFSSLPAWVQVALPAGFLLLLGLAARRVDMNQKEKAKTPDIVIDPGHGGRDPGAVNPTTNTTEKEINLSTALTLKYLLEQEGLTVALTRTGDTYPGLYDRTQDAQRAGARVFVSVHYDTYTRQARGVYYGDSAGSRELAQKIAAALPRLAEPNWVKSHKESRFGRLYIADFTAGPSVLIEFGPTAPVGRELRLELARAVVPLLAAEVQRQKR